MFVNCRRKFVLLGRVGVAKHLGFRVNIRIKEDIAGFKGTFEKVVPKNSSIRALLEKKEVK